MIDFQAIKEISKAKARYERRLGELINKGLYTENIEQTIEQSISNLKEKNVNSFVIYGEPQSGKTEMMIALTAKLLDEGYKTIVVLVNDNTQLLNQNLNRFRTSGLDPAPYKFSEILDKGFKVGHDELVVFCTKNAKNLAKLIEKIDNIGAKVIIDDEADYATPNSKINKGEITKINELVDKLRGTDGIYIGVTATPARLDLNNTYGNQNINWINFATHPVYTGQETFFPNDINDIRFGLHLLPDTGDDPKYLRKALFTFMVNVSYLNTKGNKQENNYCMLIHTSGKKVDHSADHSNIIGIFNILADTDSKKFEKYMEEIFSIAKEKFPGDEHKILEYIITNKNRKSIVIINSDGDKDNVDNATTPITLFTIAIGGNIISRGVTFDNLLCMFFTRDVKHKIQQDTYIQRARMFGSRGKYLNYFELFIPKELYLDWHRCFVYHRLALESVRNGNGLTRMEDSRVAATAGGSVDKTNISLVKGEMCFGLFEYDPRIVGTIEDASTSPIQKLLKIKQKVGEESLPQFILDFILKTSKGDDSEIAIFEPLDIKDRIKSYVNRENITTEKQSFMSDLKRRTDATHWIRIFFFSGNNKARVYYRFNNEKIRFIKNIKND